jgi:hypothetical protein
LYLIKRKVFFELQAAAFSIHKENNIQGNTLIWNGFAPPQQKTGVLEQIF